MISSPSGNAIREEAITAFSLLGKDIGFLAPIIRFVARQPGIMRSRVFMKAMKTFPAKVSRTYDEKVKKNELAYLEIKEGLRLIEGSPVRILDLCTGSGAVAILSAFSFPEATIHALDYSEEMLKIVGEKTELLNLNNVRTVRGDAASLQYADESFDLITSSNAPVYLPEIERVLRPGGFVLISFSFAGSSFIKAEKSIDRYFKRHNLEFRALKRAGKGAFAIAAKAPAMQ